MPPEWKGVATALGRFSGLDGLNRVAASINAHNTGIAWARQALSLLDVQCDISREDLDMIPPTGPAILTANHPYGMLDGLMGLVAASAVRSDIKVIANAMLEPIDALRSQFILVDVFAARTQRNVKAMAEAVAWLRSGGMLIVFPAGEVSAWNWRNHAVLDSKWHPAVTRLATITESRVIPAWFAGSNSLPFQVLGMIHPSLRTLRLPAELLNKRGARVEMRIGHPVRTEELASFATPEDRANYLRNRTLMLRYRGPRVLHTAQPQALAGSTPATLLRSEVERLHPDQLLDRSGSLEVYQARARQIPAILNEIGQLRESAFRLAGEGTGERVDLDSYDISYTHLFLWNREREEIAGAYRLVRTATVLPREGIEGLYTSTLFRYEPEFFKRIGDAVELGRSFIRPEYQKEYSSLLLLWRGIARYVAQHPDSPVLFGAVSISNSYRQASRVIISESMKRISEASELKAYVTPRKPFRDPQRAPAELRCLARSLVSLDQLSSIIRDLEPEGRGLPVLLRQYLKMGGVILDFNVDRKFGNTLDGLVLVDLRKSAPAMMSRLMGKNSWESFSRVHSLVTDAR